MCYTVPAKVSRAKQQNQQLTLQQTPLGSMCSCVLEFEWITDIDRYGAREIG